MFAAIKLAMQYKDVLPVAVDLIKEIEISIRDDGSISQKERSNLLRRFWALVKAVQAPRKAAQAQTNSLIHAQHPSQRPVERFIQTDLCPRSFSKFTKKNISDQNFFSTARSYLSIERAVIWHVVVGFNLLAVFTDPHTCLACRWIKHPMVYTLFHSSTFFNLRFTLPNLTVQLMGGYLLFRIDPNPSVFSVFA